MVGRMAAMAALCATLFTSGAEAAEYELWESDAVGVSCEVPPGFDVYESVPGGKVPAGTVRLEWGDGPYEGLRLLVVRREARYEDAAVTAGLFQRRIGATAAFEAEGEPLSPEELAAAGAEDGLRTAYVLAENEGESRLDVLFLAAGDRRYRVEISYPAASELERGDAAARMLETFKIMPAGEEAAEEAAGAGGAPEEAPSK
jgi:hypothetical protein